MLDMKYKPSQSPQAWHWPLVILRISRVMLLGSVEQAECFLLRDSATVKKENCQASIRFKFPDSQKKTFLQKVSLNISFWCSFLQLLPTQLKSVRNCCFLMLTCRTENCYWVWFLKKIISALLIFFRFDQNQQLSANCWLDCWEAIKCTVPDFKNFLPVLNSNFRIIWQKFFLYLHYILWFKSKKFVNKKLRNS